MEDSPVAIVTGGAQGIGAAICIELLKTGYRVCVADIQVSKAEEFVKEQQLNYGKEKAIAIDCEVSVESEYIKIFKHTLKTFKRVDVLVNNAGIIMEDDPRKCLEVNLLGPIYGCHTALKYMGKSNGGKGGVVINTASLAGFIPEPEMPAYVASKHGLIGLTRSFGFPFHYDRDGVTFSALCPFFVDTEILETTNKTLDRNMNISSLPGKMSPELAAKAVLKILEDRINGSTLVSYPDGFRYLELPEELRKLIRQ